MEFNLYFIEQEFLASLKLRLDTRLTREERMNKGTKQDYFGSDSLVRSRPS